MTLPTVFIPHIKSDYLMRCSVTQGSFSGEYVVEFPCYNEGNESIKESLAIGKDHASLEQQLSRIDLIDIHNQTAEIEMHNHQGRYTFKIPLDILVKNSQEES